MQESKKIYIKIEDICVACGKPTRPGYQICDACIAYVENENYEKSDPGNAVVKSSRE